MALTYTSFANFEQVEAHYDNIKPVVSKCHTREQDVRPIGDRKRKEERIIKISEHCYALVNGYEYGDPVFPPWGQQTTTITKDEIEFYAAIVWRKHRDGTTTVKIRNGSGPWNHNSRYAFLNRHTPRGMGFVVNNGKHYIRVHGGDPIYLAKGRTVPDTNRGFKGCQKHKDKTALAFKLTDTNAQVHCALPWQHLEGTGVPLPKPPRVNKALKAKYKEPLKEFFEWGMTVANMLPLNDREYTHRMEKEISDHFIDKMALGTYPPRYYLTFEDKRGIVENPEHPLRLHLFVHFCGTTSDGWWNRERFEVQEVETKEDLSSIKAQFNNWANKELGFKTNADVQYRL